MTHANPRNSPGCVVKAFPGRRVVIPVFSRRALACGLIFAAVLTTTHAQTLDMSDEAFILAQRSPETAPPAPRMDPAARDALLGQIDSFAFNLRTGFGVGGMVSVDVYPVVLFRNGDALKDIAKLDPAHVDPSTRRGAAWTRWRRANGKLEIEGKQGWEAFAFQKTYSTLPPDFRLDGLFRSLSGAGTAAVGGTTSVAAWSEYRFFADGRVIRGQGAGASSEAQDVSVVTSSVTPDRRGRHRIDGLTLHIVYDDGREEHTFLVTDPASPNSAIWLDGTGYARRKR